MSKSVKGKSKKIYYVSVGDLSREENVIRGEDSRIVGVRGFLWPDRRSVEVTMDNETDKAKNTRRLGFAEYVKGVKFSGKRVRLDKGALLRLRCGEAEPGTDGVVRLKTDWINVEVQNGQEFKEKVKLGLVTVKTRTPPDVQRKREEILQSPGFRAFVSEYREKNGVERMPQEVFNREVEARLSKAMPGRERYITTYFLYDPSGNMVGSDPVALRESLVEYFRQFRSVENERGEEYRPVKPHLIVRGLNENGEFNGAVAEFMPGHDLRLTRDESGRVTKRECMTAEECADQVIAQLPRAASWNILPARAYTHSLLQMKMGEGVNEFSLRQVYGLNRDCYEKGPDGRGRTLSFPMGLRLNESEESGEPVVVVNTLRDFADKAVDPVLVDRIERGAVPGERDRVVMLALAPEVAQRLGMDDAEEAEMSQGEDGPRP